MEAKLEQIDIVIISVLPIDELQPLLTAFGIKKGEKFHERIEGVRFWIGHIESKHYPEKLKFALTSVGAAGNVLSSVFVQQVISITKPKVALLFGIAAGLKEKCSLGDVVVSTKVVGYEPARKEIEGSIGRPQFFEPPHILLQDVLFFDPHEYNYLCRLNSVLNENENKLIGKDFTPTIHTAIIASGEKLIVDGSIDELRRTIHEKIRAVEMEALGFATACRTREKEIPWLVVRGISDYGDPSKPNTKEWRKIAAMTAAVYIKMFIMEGLISIRAHSFSEKIFQQPTLPEDSRYVKFEIPDFVRNELKKAEIEMPYIPFIWDMSFDDLEAMCLSRNHRIPKEKIHQLLHAARNKAYTVKYWDQTYDDDPRGLNIHAWRSELKMVLAKLGLQNFKIKKVLTVGSGNGLELEDTLDDAGNLICADISEKSLTIAKKKYPNIEVIVNPAENLGDIGSSSVDLYISLRTYQATLFTLERAIIEAYRVLRSGGVILLSIANGHVVEEKKLIRGIVAPSTNIVDSDRPYMIIDKIRRKLEVLGFEEMGITSGIAEIYIYGRKC